MVPLQNAIALVLLLVALCRAYLPWQLVPVPGYPFAQQHSCQLPDLWVACCMQLLHQLWDDLWPVRQLLQGILSLLAHL